MRLSLIAFGKLKTPGLRETADYYKKLTRAWISFEEIELKPLPVPDKSPATRIQIQDKEGSLLLQRIKSDSMNRSLYFLLDETGKSLTTEQWAQHFSQWENLGSTHIYLCIGSSLGFSSEVRKGAQGVLSLGAQTLPHELARVVLLEQIYRACSVLKGHPYHNSGS